MIDKRKDCPMRHENGNCTVAGGFCTAVSAPICDALHNAFDSGYYSALRDREDKKRRQYMPQIDNDKLLDLLENVEFCDMESGQYFRAVAITTESTGPVVVLEQVD